MAYSSRFGARCAPQGQSQSQSRSSSGPSQEASVCTGTSGERGLVTAVPAAYGGRHHMGSHGPAGLSEMIPTKPWGVNAAAKQYGGRHHYGAEIEAKMRCEATSPDSVADLVATEMFGGVDESEEELFAEAEALLEEIEFEG